ncbi:MAG TPA: hypothetical protein VMU65_16520 [Candidatus Saccharimonadales bacterium]|nr:hypothetical protein [Candidatus Saccharimonadales bacterium]
MRRTVLLFLFAVAEVVVVALVLHLPDIGAAGGFLGGGYPTGTTVVAASTALIWLALLAATVAFGVRMVRHIGVTAGWTRLLLGLALAGSAALLCLGVLHHMSSSYSQCCGSVNQAEQQLTGSP